LYQYFWILFMLLLILGFEGAKREYKICLKN
jgi:hypothetical protein